MRQEKLLKVLLAPHLSEKAASQYVFKVTKCANKFQIKDAVEALFKVKVKSVNIVNVKVGAAVKFGRSIAKRASWKKAYITLEAGQQINIA
ncbi:MAG: 50S ribosomal protein L23 [Coxiellaceae bacterium]|nr:50S ribosomal protein L23 [Coxiellaceae bacterium]